MPNTAKATESAIDCKRVLKLRLLVARFGEMDHARWWDTQGVLERLGQVALKRGFPKTHVFAQARIVFTVAAHRCQAVFDPPHSMTLWKLPAETEDRFEAAWSEWLDEVDEWSSFVGEIQSRRSGAPVVYTLHDAGRYLYPELMVTRVREEQSPLLIEALKLGGPVEPRQQPAPSFQRSSKRPIITPRPNPS